jgi:hypothetical protein
VELPNEVRILALVAGSCGSTPLEAAPQRDLRPVAHEQLCVTKGTIDNGAVTEPAVRAFARGSDGDAAQLRFTYRGDSATARALSSGQLRRQVGLKLRAQDSCNVVYVMWRLDPKSKLEVSVKSNPGKRTHDECGADGYTKVKPAVQVAELEDGHSYTLRAEIVGDELTAWIDGKVAWRAAELRARPPRPRRTALGQRALRHRRILRTHQPTRGPGLQAYRRGLTRALASSSSHAARRTGCDCENKISRLCGPQLNTRSRNPS